MHSLKSHVVWCLAAIFWLIAPAGAGAAQPLLPQGPPTPKVSAKRSGRLLTLGCELHNADGSKYLPKNAEEYGNPPRFAIYQGDRLIGSGSFEYG